MDINTILGRNQENPPKHTFLAINLNQINHKGVAQQSERQHHCRENWQRETWRPCRHQMQLFGHQHSGVNLNIPELSRNEQAKALMPYRICTYWWLSEIQKICVLILHQSTDWCRMLEDTTRRDHAEVILAKVSNYKWVCCPNSSSEYTFC